MISWKSVFRDPRINFYPGDHVDLWDEHCIIETVSFTKDDAYYILNSVDNLGHKHKVWYREANLAMYAHPHKKVERK